MRVYSTRNSLITFWAACGLAMASYYNGCSQAVFDTSLASKKVDLLSTALILINKDAPYTNDENVQINLSSALADEVYVTNDSECKTGGAWEPITKSLDKSWTLAQPNQEVKVYAKFRNRSEGVTTKCLEDSIVHDEELPTVLLQQPKIYTNVATPVFYFLAGDTVSGLDKTVCEWPGKTSVDCQFSSSDGNLAEKRYLVKVRAYDKAGNESLPIEQDMIVDRTNPVVTILSAPSALSNSTTATVTFNAADNLAGIKTIECAWDNATAFNACTSATTKVLAEGPHTFYVRASDRADNASSVVSHSFTIDLTAPEVRITSAPPDFSKTATADFTFDGKDGNMTITEFECRIDGGAFSACNSPKSYSGLAEGLRKFEVRGRDNAGNFSAPVARSWYVDLTLPSITFNQTPATYTNSQTAVYKYTITDVGTGVLKAECRIDTGAYAPCLQDGTSFAMVGAGAHTVSVMAYDKAGNTRVATHTFTIDLTPPAVAFTNVPPALTKVRDFLFGFSAVDNDQVARLECRIDGDAYANCDTMTSDQVTGAANGAHKFYVRAFDRSGNPSVERTHDWYVDFSPPTITYNLPPQNKYANTEIIKFNFTVSDAHSGVQSYTCTLNGVATPCVSGENKTLGPLAAGVYTWVITAVDKAGNQAVDSKMFESKLPTLKEQSTLVKENTKLDVLVVVDNSGSMAAEQKNMGDRFGRFLEKIKTLDWQIGVITTDTDADANLKDGRLVELEGYPGQYILKPNTPNAQKIFSDTVQMPTDGSGREWGIKAAMRAIQRAALPNVAVNVPNAMLFRPDAALAVIVVSDALDDSGKTPDDFINLVKMQYPDKAYTFHSLVVPESPFTVATGNAPAGDPCKDYRENIRFDGRIYHALSDRTGGIKGTVCAADYSAQLTNVGRATAELVKSVTLDCNPVDTNGDAIIDNRDVTVTDPGGANIVDFVISANKLTFTAGLPLGTNMIKYYCVQ